MWLIPQTDLQTLSTIEVPVGGVIWACRVIRGETVM